MAIIQSAYSNEVSGTPGAGGMPNTGKEYAGFLAHLLIEDYDHLDTVTSIDDVTGNGRHYVKGSSPFPTFRLVDDMPFINVTGNQTLTCTFGAALAQPYVVLTVMKETDPLTTDIWLLGSGDSADRHHSIIRESSEWRFRTNPSGTPYIALGPSATLFKNWSLVRTVADSSGAGSSVAQNGTVLASGATGTSSASNLRLGGLTSGQFPQGAQYAAQIILAAPGSADVAAWEAYLTEIYGPF